MAVAEIDLPVYTISIGGPLPQVLNSHIPVACKEAISLLSQYERADSGWNGVGGGKYKVEMEAGRGMCQDWERAVSAALLISLFQALIQLLGSTSDLHQKTHWHRSE